MLTTSFSRNRFHVTHYGGCAVFFIKDTSIYLHDIRRVLPDTVFDGESGWVIQGIISRAFFRQKAWHREEKLILAVRAVMLEELVDVVAGDFNGVGDATPALLVSVSLKRPSPTVPCRCLPAPHHCGVQGRFRVMWADVCGFLNTPESDERWRVRQHGALPIPHEALGIRQTDQSCRHEVWLHMDFVEQRNGQAHQKKHRERRLLLKERSSPCHHNKPKYPTGGDASDHSLSSEDKATSSHKNRRGFQRGRQRRADLHRRTLSGHQGHQQLTR